MRGCGSRCDILPGACALDISGSATLDSPHFISVGSLVCLAAAHLCATHARARWLVYRALCRSLCHLRLVLAFTVYTLDQVLLAAVGLS